MYQYITKVLPTILSIIPKKETHHLTRLFKTFNFQFSIFNYSSTAGSLLTIVNSSMRFVAPANLSITNNT